MRVRFTYVTLLMLFLAWIPASAATTEEARVAEATDVLDQFLRIPEQSIPPTLLARAYAIAVIPNEVKVGFVLGGSFGRGILVVRDGEHSWSDPAFISMAAGSLGFQIGAQATDVILVFKTRSTVDNISNGKLTLGADASVAAGPVGRHTGAATDFRFQAEVFSYSRSRGIFAGVALGGASIRMDRKANAAFYGSPDITPEIIFAGETVTTPQVADNFVQMLTAKTDRLPAPSSLQAGTDTSAAPEPKDKPSVETYGIAEPDDVEVSDGGVAQEF